MRSEEPRTGVPAISSENDAANTPRPASRRLNLASVGMRFGTAGISLVVGVVLARLLGAAEYGVYAYVMAWATVLAVPASLGLQSLLVREVASYVATERWPVLRGVIQRSLQAAGVASLLLALAAAAIALTAEGWTGRSAAFVAGMMLVPLMAIGSLRLAILRGLHRVVAGQLPDLILRPLIILVGLGAIYLFVQGQVPAVAAVGLNVIAALAVVIVGTVMLARSLPRQVYSAEPAYELRRWTRTAVVLLLATSMGALIGNVDVIMLGLISGTEEAGIYRVASRGADIVALAIVGVNFAVAPTFARLIAQRDSGGLQRAVTAAARNMVLVALPVSVLLLAFGDGFLRLFGSEFVLGRSALSVLVIGQLFNAFVGSVATVLTMAGHERDTAIGVFVAAVVNVALNALLIPQWGALGAAIAGAGSVAAWNVLLAIAVFRRLGVHSTALGRLGPPGRLDD